MFAQPRICSAVRCRQLNQTATRAASSMPADLGIVWFRRDLRVVDHPALLAASEECSSLVAAHIVSDDELQPRRNQSDATTGVPRMGPHQLRCACLISATDGSVHTLAARKNDVHSKHPTRRDVHCTAATEQTAWFDGRQALVQSHAARMWRRGRRLAHIRSTPLRPSRPSRA